MATIPRDEHRRSAAWPVLALLLVLVVAVVAVFGRTVTYGFTDYDERMQLIDNPLVRDLSPSGIARMFTVFCITSYYPVRLLSFAIDYAMWGDRPAGYHVTQVVLHVANAALVYLLLWRVLRGGTRAGARARPTRKGGGRGGVQGAGSTDATGAPEGGWWPALTALVGALLFALHPVVVEVVAWVGAREEILMMFFALLALHAHRSAVRAAGRRSVVWYALSGVAYACACMCNVVAVVVPAIVVAYDVCVAGRRRPASLVAGTWFLWVLALITLGLRKQGNALASRLAEQGAGWLETLELTPGERVLAIFATYAQNLRTIVWPKDLVLIYPKTVPAGVLTPGVLFGVGAVALTLVGLWFVRRRGLVLFGLLWFLFALAPSSQVISHQIVRADRFLYLPLVGLVTAVAGGLVLLRGRGVARAAATVACLVLAVAAGVRSYAQTAVWRDSRSVYEHVLRVNPNEVHALVNLGIQLANEGDVAGALRHFERAADVAPTDTDVLFNIGVAYRRLGRPDEAIAAFERALAVDSRLTDADREIAEIYEEQGRLDEAVRQLRRALQIRPDDLKARRQLAAILVRQQNLDAAAVAYEAILRMVTDDADAHEALGTIRMKQGDERRAVGHYRAALKARPGWPRAANNLAWILATSPDATLREGAEAVRLSEMAARAAGGRSADVLDTLAAAYAEAGDFDRAVEVGRRAVAIARESGDTEAAAGLQHRLTLYENGQPYRRP
jgi:tetratricopeptide (TPR) repeat protein